MKAWLVRRNDEFGAIVVFAKTRSYALRTEEFEDADYCELEVSRVKQMDKYYVEGKKRMEWLDSKDRIALVKDCDFICEREYLEREDCPLCPAKEFCADYQEYLTEKGGAEE